MHLFLAETVKPIQRQEQQPACLSKILEAMQKRLENMRNAAAVVASRYFPFSISEQAWNGCFVNLAAEATFLFCSPTLRGISLVSFFYELGMSGITGVLFVSLSFYMLYPVPYQNRYSILQMLNSLLP